MVYVCVLDGRSAAREPQRDRGPSGEHPPAEPGAAAADARHRQLHSPGISGVYEGPHICSNTATNPKNEWADACVFAV